MQLFGKDFRIHAFEWVFFTIYDINLNGGQGALLGEAHGGRGHSERDVTTSEGKAP